MGTTFIFFISLLVSIIFIESTIVDIVNKAMDNKSLRFFTMILSCLLWSAFYYLNK